MTVLGAYPHELKERAEFVRTFIGDMEITPAMIKAGADITWELDGQDKNYIAEMVFRAMIAAI